MSDPEQKPKRRFWQIHLLTAAILTFVGGCIILPNIKPQPEMFMDSDQSHRVTTRVVGWPYRYSMSEGEDLERRVHGTWLKVHIYFPLPEKFDAFLLAVDITVVIFLLCATYFVCEYLSRRREGRKT